MQIDTINEGAFGGDSEPNQDLVGQFSPPHEAVVSTNFLKMDDEAGASPPMYDSNEMRLSAIEPY